MGLVTQSVNENDGQVFTVSSGDRRFSFTMDGDPRDIKMDIGVFSGRNTFLNLMKRPVVRIFIALKFEEVDLQHAHRMILSVAAKAAELDAGEIADELLLLGLITDEHTMPSPFHGSKPVDIVIISGVDAGYETSFSQLMHKL